jgi:hypothetical protein
VYKINKIIIIIELNQAYYTQDIDKKPRNPNGMQNDFKVKGRKYFKILTTQTQKSTMLV